MSLKYGSDESSFLFLRHFFLSRFFFLNDESEKDFFDDECDNDGSGYGLSGTRPFHFLKIPLVLSVDYFNLVESLEYSHLVESMEYFHLSESNIVESIEYFPAQKHS